MARAYSQDFAGAGTVGDGDRNLGAGRRRSGFGRRRFRPRSSGCGRGAAERRAHGAAAGDSPRRSKLDAPRRVSCASWWRAPATSP